MPLSPQEAARQEMSRRRHYKAKTPKHLTDYRSGSMLDAIREIEDLAELATYRGHAAGVKDASAATRRRWAKALDAKEAALTATAPPA